MIGNKNSEEKNFEKYKGIKNKIQKNKSRIKFYLCDVFGVIKCALN